MAALVNDELVLEEDQEVVWFLVLHDTHLNGGAAILVVEVLGPERACSLLILTAASNVGQIASQS